MSDKRVLVNENSLIAIGSAIREKNGTDASYKPGEMAAAILEIQTGIEPVGDITITENGEYDVVNYAKAIVEVAGSGGGDVEIPVITGDCQYRFAYDGWNWTVEAFGDQMRTEDIESCQYMFYNSEKLTEIPFEINCKGDYSGGTNCANMFSGCHALEAIPKINNCKPSKMNNLFNSCKKIRYFPEDMATWFDFSGIDNATSAYNYYEVAGIFNNCSSLRSIPMEFLNHENSLQTGYFYTIYYGLVDNCYALDEIVDIPVHEKWTTNTLTNNTFSNAFRDCHRLKRLTFKLYDGAPRVVKWKGQSIRLEGATDYGVGYLGQNHTFHKILNNNSGITNDKRVYDDATYQALKDDPDWVAVGPDDIYSELTGMPYSRYNRISAVETINTLPDTSAYLATAGGTNTISFRGAAGSATDGGAINTMTEEEIAVAAAKGWTVSFS